ncbi:hypothetical protein J2S74_005499 [Evansella vedderi]|uniref:Uncharacterized protein n=1 Tax=Evansella vedderi TaxID=38282 RepID=A0ABU0A3G7_9BACI|nr:hypothetical protein [Evansella vedderi]MDQ0258036.1 hypothetical protein [Evansella vedderi]
MRNSKVWVCMSILLSILIGCSTDNGDEVYQLEGRFAGYGFYSNPTELMLNVFVEDNIFGSSMKFSYWEPVPQDYEMEAYRLIITEETEVYLGDSDEKIELLPIDYSRPPILSHGNKIVATLTTPLERISSNRKEYALYNHALFPIYKAEEVRIYNLSKREFITMYSPYRENEYILISVFEEDSEQAWDTFMELEQKLFHERTHEINIQSWFQAADSPAFPEVTLDMEEYPYFLLLSDKGLVKETTDSEEIFLFFEDLKTQNE